MKAALKGGEKVNHAFSSDPVLPVSPWKEYSVY
jgi:hypothetical protein